MRTGATMVAVNLTHPLTDAQMGRIGELAAERVERVHDLLRFFGEEHAFTEQALDRWGVGGKTSSGYGRLDIHERHRG